LIIHGGKMLAKHKRKPPAGYGVLDVYVASAMFTASDPSNCSKAEHYDELAAQLRALTEGETDAVANMANCAALIFNSLPSLNWAGFYLLKNEELILGPFQGQPACVRIALGRGVCGTAAANHATLRVADVTKFPGHIACDSASRSEIVLPLLAEDSHLIGVLDVDSPELDRFDAEDEAGLSTLARIIARKI
jgi:GAF domain-containing protein